jgi:hypothetical protein
MGCKGGVGAMAACVKWMSHHTQNAFQFLTVNTQSARTRKGQLFTFSVPRSHGHLPKVPQLGQEERPGLSSVVLPPDPTACERKASPVTIALREQPPSPGSHTYQALEDTLLLCPPSCHSVFSSLSLVGSQNPI